MADKQCSSPPEYCQGCPLTQDMGRCGLLWIGEKHYKTPDAWRKEARVMGISRRVKAVPKGFELGKTWVLVAHRKAITNPDGSFTPGIFQAFKPEAVEKIMTGNESDEEVEKLIEHGYSPVLVKRRKATFEELDEEDYA
jgi:hypothetical protein